MENKNIVPKAVKITLLVLFLVAVVSIYMNVRFLGQIRDLKDPHAVADTTIQRTLAQVGKLIVLPSNEQPTLATVSDLSKLKDQPFFEHAAIGDQVIIFTTARKAILWRPSENKIVEVAPLSVNNNQGAAAATAVESAAPAGPAVTPSPTPSPSAPVTTPKPKR